MQNTKYIHNSWQRQYRAQCKKRSDEVTFQLLMAESDIHVIATQNLASTMLCTLEKLRKDLRTWITMYPEFRTSLAPLPIPLHAPEIIVRMYKAAEKCGVGPFAAVAGSIAQMLTEAHIHESSELIVENGGDTYLYSQKKRIVGILSDPESNMSIGLALDKEDFPVALCASSATIGHSLSFGQGELALVRSKDAALADALATALGNRLRNAKDVQMTLEYGQSIDEVEGIFVQCDAAMGIWGNMELIGISTDGS